MSALRVVCTRGECPSFCVENVALPPMLFVLLRAAFVLAPEVRSIALPVPMCGRCADGRAAVRVPEIDYTTNLEWAII